MRSRLGLTGLTHIIGPAGSGKTLLAAALAADTSRNSQVEWINTDGKTRFIPHLKATISLVGGNESNVSLILSRGHLESLDSILCLPKTISDSTSLIVVDPITRVVDMARRNPVMWGQELMEAALPTLAAISEERGIDVIIVSESRLIPDIGAHPVLLEAISKWTDQTVQVVQRALSQARSVLVHEGANYLQVAELSVNESGACILKIENEKPKMKEESEECLAGDY